MRSFTWPSVRAWRMARQHLVPGAAAGSVEEAVRDAAGIQAQVASSAEQAVVLRTARAEPDDVREALWERRSLVRTWAMRGTLHLFAADEYPAFVAALSTRRSWRTGAWLRWMEMTIDDVERLIAAIDLALTGRCLTRGELADEVAAEAGPAMREHLLSSWGGVLKPAAYLGVLCSGPNRGQNATFVRPADWLGPVTWLEPDDGWRVICRRFLRAYGPATHEDLGDWWGGRSNAKRALARIADELTRVDVEGRPAWLLSEDLEALAASAPPPARSRGSVVLLPGFDAYVMGASPRTSVVPAVVRPKVSRTAGWISPVMLVDGVAAGVWKPERTREGTVILVEAFAPPNDALRRRVERAARRLEPALGPIGEVRFEDGIHG